ncbi:MAG: TonB-dependent receptor [Candidatus Eisenbacteria bacterium]
MRTLPLAAAAAVLLALGCAAAPAFAARVTGTVVDRAGKPVEYANVRVPALQKGVIADERGVFALELPDGPCVLECAQIGYQKSRVTLTVRDGLAPLHVTLHDEPVPVAEVNVEASAFGKTGKSEGAVVRRADVLMTPGGAADIFQSLRALPGINAPAEGAALYVRGGDPSETIIRLDGAEIGHPYHYEGASGGLFSILDAYMLKSAFFSSGGFTSKYGGAMSGVLDIETSDPMNLRAVNVGANMAGYGVSTTWALVPDRLSLLVTTAKSIPEMLLRANGISNDYVQAPWSENGAAKLLWRYSPTGRLSVFGIGSNEHLALEANALNVKEVYASNARNAFGAVHLQDAILGRVAVRGNLTTQAWRSAYRFGDFTQRTDERTTQGDVDLTLNAGARHQLSAGGVWRRRAADRSGLAAADSTDLASGAPRRAFGTARTTREPGFYLEDKLRVAGALYATIGARLDRAQASARWTTDPRAALALLVDEHQTLRVAAGRYHQLPNLTLLDARYGNPTLAPAYADHFIAGYEWKSDFGNVRLEGYEKRYHGLPLVDPVTWYRAAGTGRARGADVFVQGTWRRLNGWVSYGWLDSRRRQNDDPEEVPASGAVKHSLSVVGQYQWNGRWHTGARWAHSSGRPYTPVTGAVWDPSRHVWHPVYGAHGSATMPAYDRLDIRLMRLFSLPKLGGIRASNVCVAYLEAMNVLDTPNVLEYVYNSDWSERRPEYSYFSDRMLVAGFGLSW